MAEFLTAMASVVTNIAGQFGTVGADLIDSEVLQLVIGLSVFSYLFNKSIKLIRQIKRG